MERPVYSIPFFSSGGVLIALDGNSRPKRAAAPKSIRFTTIRNFNWTNGHDDEQIRSIAFENFNRSALHIGFTSRYGMHAVLSSIPPVRRRSSILTTRRFDLRTRFRVHDAEISLSIERLLFDFRILPCRNRVYETTRSIDAILRRFSRVTRPLVLRMVPIARLRSQSTMLMRALIGTFTSDGKKECRGTRAAKIRNYRIARGSIIAPRARSLFNVVVYFEKFNGQERKFNYAGG